MVVAQRREDARRGKKDTEENNAMLQADVALNKLLTSEGFHTSSCLLLHDYVWFLAALAFKTICLSDCAGEEH